MAKTSCSSNHILIGLGGTGGKILRAFKMRMFEEFPDAKEREKQSVALLYIDSTKEMMPKDGRPRPDFRVMGLDASFTEEEFLFIKGTDIGHMLDHIDNYPSVRGIIKDAGTVKTAIGNIGEAAGQKRRAGRLLFAANAVGYVNALRNAYARIIKISGKEGGNDLNIHIFAGLCGGTGSGSIIDAIVQARKLYPEAIISVYAMIPEQNLPKANIDQGRYYQNGYAALNELNALQAGRLNPHDITGNGEEIKVFSDRIKGVANGVTLYSNVNDNGQSLNSFEELPKVVSDFVYARVFLINSENKVNADIIRAYTYENMDDFALEYDELGDDSIIDNSQKLVARTKKINSFGIKRVMYPELRVLKHITYTIGESILLQFKYNNWRDELGYVDEEAKKDYREMYLNDNTLERWMLDDRHLTLETRILKSDKAHPAFADYWHDKAVSYPINDPSFNKNACPLNELDSLLAEEYFSKQFRGVGVVSFFRDKAKSIPDMAKEIRGGIERDLFEKWKSGDVSIVELQKVSHLLLEKVAEIRVHIDEAIIKNAEAVNDIQLDCKDNVTEWSNLNILQRLAQKGKRIYSRHQNDLADLYHERTRTEALQFAKALATRILNELQNMDTDLSAFGQVINTAIEDTEKLITAQRKVNGGIEEGEDMKGAIIEVSEEETMQGFEEELKIDKTDMPTIASQIRNAILPKTEFVNFGRLASELSIDQIRDAFDIKLSEIVRAKHSEKADADKKVLGLNILTQLQQKLTTDEDIRSFAYKISQQSGVFLKLNNDQIQLHVRNNEGHLAPSNPASINKKVILVSIPKPASDSQKAFADKLERAFKGSFAQGTAITDIVFNTQSPRENELSIITVAYCFPMRCAEWLQGYKKKYDDFLHTGNRATDVTNAILLHTEGDGKDLPSIFVVDRPAKKSVDTTTTVTPPPVEPNIRETTTTVTPPPMADPQVQMFLYIAGQQYGPYDYAMLRQFVSTGQLTPQTMVWQQGMASWQPASQVKELSALFAPSAVPPPMPPTPGSMPPPMPPTM